MPKKDDPWLVLPERAVNGKNIDFIKLSIQTSEPLTNEFTQIFFTDSEVKEFSEASSISIPLQPRTSPQELFIVLHNAIKQPIRTLRIDFTRRAADLRWDEIVLGRFADDSVSANDRNRDGKLRRWLARVAGLVG